MAQLLLFSITILSNVAAEALPHHPIKALVALITKDTSTSLYTLTLNTNKPFLLDLNGPFLYSPCPPYDHPNLTLTPTPTLTNISINATDGETPTGAITVPKFVASCANKGLLRSLPANSIGAAGLGRSRLSVPSQLFSKLSLKTQFAICLPSSQAAAPGVAFFGSGPYNLMPPTLFDVSSILSYTPLLKNAMNPSYYIELNGIAVNGEELRVRGSAKLSTGIPYTALRSDIYRRFLSVFAKAAEGIPRVKNVKPFDLCMNSSSLGFSRVGYVVPQVDLMLPGGRNWTIFGSNSVKQVGPDTVCLAVVDGGSRAEQAVAIGGFQMENNFLLFDEGKNRLGFSSTLFFMRLTCGNFDFNSRA